MTRFLNFLPLIYGLTPSDWLPFVTLTPTYSIISYGNIIFIYAFSSYVHFSGTQMWYKTRDALDVFGEQAAAWMIR